MKTLSESIVMGAMAGGTFSLAREWVDSQGVQIALGLLMFAICFAAAKRIQK